MKWGTSVLLILKAVATGNTVTKQKKPVITFTPSISGIWGTHPVFHFYPHSALSSSSCSYFYLLSSCAECTTAGWCKTGRVTWDNGAFHCSLAAAQPDSITAGYLCHLIVAFVRLTAQTAHLWLQYVFQQLSEVKDMTGTCPQYSLRSGLWAKKLIPVSLVGGWCCLLQTGNSATKHLQT